MSDQTTQKDAAELRASLVVANRTGERLIADVLFFEQENAKVQAMIDAIARQLRISVPPQLASHRLKLMSQALSKLVR